ncbi:hypothetical protein BH10CYA1_BH10CYA1_28070 [soil metagenome]
MTHGFTLVVDEPGKFLICIKNSWSLYYSTSCPKNVKDSIVKHLWLKDVRPAHFLDFTKLIYHFFDQSCQPVCLSSSLLPGFQVESLNLELIITDKA